SAACRGEIHPISDVPPHHNFADRFCACPSHLFTQQSLEAAISRIPNNSFKELGSIKNHCV
ncbi:MAG: hypothetical protein PVF37_09655, partial [Desulfobacterales bacterium]